MTSSLLTVNPDESDADTQDFLEQQAELYILGHSPDPSYWSTRTLTHEAGERVYLLRQGKEPRGIMASGWLVTGESEPDESFRDDGKQAHYVWIEWDAFLDAEDLLPVSALKNLAPSTYWHPQASGSRVKPQDEATVEQAWDEHLAQYDLNVIENGDPTDDSIVPSYANAFRRVRRHQRAFRQLLLRTYEAECAYCGLDVFEVLEAAHLIPDRDGGLPTSENGRLLCANHHRAFDAGLLRWDKKRFVAVKGAPVVLPAPHRG